MVGIAQLVRASDCGSEGRGFESHYPPKKTLNIRVFLLKFNRLDDAPETFLIASRGLETGCGLRARHRPAALQADRCQ